MIELKRLKLINWHNFENVTFDCARLTYMIGVNAVGKTTILDAIRYCLTTNRNFNALGNKKSGPHPAGVRSTPSSAARTPTAARAIPWPISGPSSGTASSAPPLSSRCGWSPKAPCRSCTPATRHGTFRRTASRWNSCPSSTRAPVHPAPREDFKPETGRLSYTRSPSEARDRICRALGIGRASSPLGKKFNEVFQMGTSMDEIPNFREFLYQYILPQPELDLDALQGDRLELENLHAVLAEAQTRADALEEIVNFGREAAEKQTQTLVNRGAALLARAAADGGEQTVWQEHLDAGRRQLEQLNARYAGRQKCRSGSPPGLSFRPRCRQRQRRGPGTGRPDRGAFPPQNGAGRRRTQSRKRQRAPLPAPRACWRCCAAAALRPASGPKRSPPRSCRS